MTRAIGSLVVAALVMTLTACGDRGAQERSETVQTPQATAATPPPKPEVEVPEGDPPPELVIEDITVGRGREAEAGDMVVVHYVGVSWSTREEFDNSYDRGQPVPFQLVEGGLIQGWIEGIPGMRVGGRRKLTIPPHKGYGSSGRGPIAPDETLVFIVDLVHAEAPQG
ncbi:MAG TPA: FKBP-type peptidyl-prolyl cis-trans isomerase [Actinomycetota bacterium]|nr:FKBP-type peptidyl-prolyl cis-trans isomerase [Actinomycetota bacterium]